MPKLISIVTSLLLSIALFTACYECKSQPAKLGDAEDLSDGDLIEDAEALETEGEEVDNVDTDTTLPELDGDLEEMESQELEDEIIERDENDKESLEGDESTLPFWKQEWTLPERTWPTGETEFATERTLKAKAEYYQWIVPRLHRIEGDTDDGRHIVHALFHHTYLDRPAPTSIVPDDELPNIVRFESYGNAGLWTSHYVASQAFRYAVAMREGDAQVMADALSEVRISLKAIYDLMRITGVDGLYARGYYSPLPLFTHPTAEGDTHFVEDGEFKGYTWHGDVSQDEYSGHMFALGIVAKLVDDVEVQTICRDIATKVGHHLMDNDLWITDVDGEPTSFGKMNALSGTHYPGYNAWQSLTWMKIAAIVSGDSALEDFYKNCLLQQNGENECIEHRLESPKNYTEYFSSFNIFAGCETNYDSVSMAFLAAANLIWFEEDDILRALYQKTLHDKLVIGDPTGRNITTQANPLYNMIYAAMMDYTDETATEPEALIDDALKTLKEFPAHQVFKSADTTTYPEYCTSSRHGSLTETPYPFREGKVDIFVWWDPPYVRETMTADPNRIEPPADFLLPYWMGRYFGWITPEM